MGTDPLAGDAVALDPVATALEGATRDFTVSGDAMRWSPDLADFPPDLTVGLATAGEEGLAGVDAAVGLGAALGLDGAALQRLVTGALVALPGAARPQPAGPSGEPDADVQPG